MSRSVQSIWFLHCDFDGCEERVGSPLGFVWALSIAENEGWNEIRVRDGSLSLNFCKDHAYIRLGPK